MTERDPRALWRRLAGWAGLPALALALAGCPAQSQDIPNRVLDRPLDLALTCVHVECDAEDECHGEAASLRECRGETGGCGTSGNHLVGFVANSERNEVAVFTQCSGELVDMDLGSPGYNFIPVGTLPSAMTQSTDGCRAIAANAGSCDLSVLDAPNLGAFGLGIRTPTRLTSTGNRVPVEPSSLVANVIPRRLDPEDGWVPVAARPGSILAVPRQLSNSGDNVPPEDPILDSCGPDQPGSVYVSFPSCNTVAEIDLVTHRVLQSFRFELTDDGVDVIDTGVNPECAVDCPDVFEDGVPGDLPPADDAGLNPVTIELVTPPFSAEGNCSGDADPCTDDADCAVEDASLFVGGLGSDRVIEIPIDLDSREWSADIRELELVGASGIERIRATPAMDDGPKVDSEFGNVHQFLYVVSGDGSTRVVRRELDPDRSDLGLECDTQVDPVFAQSNPVCYPVTSTPIGVQPPDRRAFANGPGIRAPDNARITDWVFKKVPEDTLGCLDVAADTTPFGGPGRVVGVGTTNAGRLVFATLGQFDAVPSLGDTLDPVELMDVGVRWHMLFPEFAPVGGSAVEPLTLPSVADEDPVRRLPDDALPTRVLSPGFRRIDYAYAYDPEESGQDADRQTLFAAYGIDNVDRQGGPKALENDPEAYGLFQKSVVRAHARDYRAWGPTTWELQWEGLIPGATSSTGRLACDEPGWPWKDGDPPEKAATCRPQQDGDSRLLDDGADFCSSGVLAGDKLVLIGCDTDQDCGDGQKCLDEPGSLPGSGLCVSEKAYAKDESLLRQVCAEFISDPCGEPHREFTITRAFRNELWLQAMDIPPTSYLECETENPEDDCESTNLVEHEATFVCTEVQPDGGCSVDKDCEEVAPGSLCIENRCREECTDPNGCLLRRLPGPACFREFVRYQVRARNAFLMVGGGPASFMPDQVYADADSLSPYSESPECKRAEPSAGVSSLLTSRIPLGPDEDHLDLPVCPPGDNSPSAASVNPCLITLDRDGNEKSRFHYFEYEGDGKPVTAVRYTNPVMSVILDLVDLRALGTAVPESERLGKMAEGTLWPEDFRHFKRSRIPRGYKMEFGTTPGYRPINAAVGIGSVGLTFPVRTRLSPDLNWVFVVDASGPGTSTAIRGQVLRVDVASNPPLADTFFDGVR